MQELNLEQLRKIQLEILDYVVSFCDERGINYWLDSGTLIGAVRHGGYIPWDDDIDIGMLRKDYDVFLESFCDPNNRYTVHHLKNDESYPCAFAKVFDEETVLYEPDENGWHYKVNIDIFPYDYIPSDPQKTKKCYFWRDVWKICNAQYLIKTRPHGIFLRRLLVYLFRVMIHVLPKSFYVNRLIEVQTRYDDTGYIGNMSASARIVCPVSIFDKFTDVRFEGKTYKAPVGYDAWLRAFYGDYMQLPPIEERVSHHSFKAYRK